MYDCMPAVIAIRHALGVDGSFALDDQQLTRASGKESSRHGGRPGRWRDSLERLAPGGVRGGWCPGATLSESERLASEPDSPRCQPRSIQTVSPGSDSDTARNGWCGTRLEGFPTMVCHEAPSPAVREPLSERSVGDDPELAFGYKSRKWLRERGHGGVSRARERPTAKQQRIPLSIPAPGLAPLPYSRGRGSARLRSSTLDRLGLGTNGDDGAAYPPPASCDHTSLLFTETTTWARS
jgi:hypothetical protein